MMMLFGCGITGMVLGFVSSTAYFDYRRSHIPPLSDTDMSEAVMGGRIPGLDSLDAGGISSMQHRCDSTDQVQYGNPFLNIDTPIKWHTSYWFDGKIISKHQWLKIKEFYSGMKSNGASHQVLNDRASPLLQKKPCDTVYINSGTVMVTKVIHDTIYLAAPTPNQPTYIK
jgi:hypothetical protein